MEQEILSVIEKVNFGSRGGHLLRLGSRQSRLALWQSRAVAETIVSRFPEFDVDIVCFDTQGDQNLHQALAAIGGKGLFTVELDQAIQQGRIDFAVHSMKDLPTVASPGMQIIPVLPREDARDVLISRDGRQLFELRQGAVIGTSSPRRESQLKFLRRDLQIVSIRGNVSTRIAKVRTPMYDAIVLAAAGVLRLGLEDSVTQWLEFGELLPAPGQGALAATCLADNGIVRQLLEQLSDETTAIAVTAERAFLQELAGGCSAPIAALATVPGNEGNRIKLCGRVASTDGTQVYTHTVEGDTPLSLAVKLAGMFQQGEPAKLLQSIRDCRLSQSFKTSPNFNPSKSAAVPFSIRWENAVRRQLLQGKKVVVTRALSQAGEATPLIRELGGTSVEIPLIDFQKQTSHSASVNMLNSLSEFDWLVFTSTNSIRFFFELLQESPLPPTLKIACVGTKTARCVEEFGYVPAFVPDQFIGDRLSAQLPLESSNRILVPSAKVSNDRLVEVLQARGADVVRWPLYETNQVPLDKSQRNQIRTADIVLFASPSAIDSFCDQTREDAEVLNHPIVACIGSMTQQRCLERGIPVNVIPSEFTFPNLVLAVAEFVSENTSKNGGQPWTMQ